MSLSTRRMATAALVLAVCGLLFPLWFKGQQLLLTLLMLIGAAALAGWLGGDSPVPVVNAEEPETRWPFLRVLLAAAALACSYYTYEQVLLEHWRFALGGLIGSAIAWRGAGTLEPPALGKKKTLVVLMLLVAVAAGLRMTRLEEVPKGFVMVDEPLIMAKARTYHDGDRQTYASGGVWVDGSIPLYLEALGMKVFGQSLGQFRMEGAFLGTLMTILFFFLGRALAGDVGGLVIAAAWAAGLWPVTISRAPYFMVETVLITLMCFLFLWRGLRDGKGYYFAFAGLFWGFCFSVYTAAQVMLALVPWLLLVVALVEPKKRGVIAKGWMPLLAGMLIGLAPLAIWMWQGYPDTARGYFSNFSQGHKIGVVEGVHGPLGMVDAVLGRVFGTFARGVSLFTKRGSNNPWYFPLAYPIVHPVVLFFFLTGLSACFARFRHGLHAFLIYWWFAGLLPMLASNPGTCPDDRRAIMALAPMILIAGTGFSASLGVASRLFPVRMRTAVLIAALLGSSAWLTTVTYDHYFNRNQQSYDLLSWDRVYGTQFAKTVFEENAKRPVVVISTRRTNADDWNAPSDDPYRREFECLNPGVPVNFTQRYQAYYEEGGLEGALRWGRARAVELAGKDAKPYDLLVVLTPFHYYMQGALESLGGKLVKEVPLVRANEGLLRGDVSYGYDEHSAMRLVRLPAPEPQALDGLRSKALRLRFEELQPPAMKREALANLYINDPAYQQVATSWMTYPGAWKRGRAFEAQSVDPWFWVMNGGLPKSIVSPMRISFEADLTIEAPGEYAFGASTTGLARISVDGRPVFKRDPTRLEELGRRQPTRGYLYDHDQLGNEEDRRGQVGAAVHLQKGEHRLRVEAAFLSQNPIFNIVFRPVWSRDGGPIQSLPVELLSNGR